MMRLTTATATATATRKNANVWKMAGLLAMTMMLMMPTQTSAVFPTNESSYLNFPIPQAFHQEHHGYNHSVAHFGSYYYDFIYKANSGMKTVVAPLKMLHDADSELCNDVNRNSTKFLREYDGPFMLLLDRSGECSYVQKVRRAQELGASGVVIANHICACDEANCNSDGNDDDSTKCESEPPIMADDGSGKDISIPSMMIQKTVGDAIKETIKQGKKPFLVEMKWQFPRFEKSVQFDFWYNPVDITSAWLLDNLTTVTEFFDEGQMDLHIHYSLLDGHAYHCNGNAEKPQDDCYNMCTNQGRYCAVPHMGISGKEIVLETLRRLCIQKHYSDDNNIMHYLQHFADWCHNKDFFSNENCLSDAFEHSHVDSETIETCMKDSGDVAKDDLNTLLQGTLDKSKKYGILQTPSVMVNDLPMTEFLSPTNILEALCMGFDHGKAPHVCYQCGNCGDPVACVSRSPMRCLETDGQDKEEEKTPARGHSKKKNRGWKWFLFLMLLGGGGGFVYYKKVVEEGGDGLGAYNLQDALMSDTA